MNLDVNINTSSITGTDLHDKMFESYGIFVNGITQQQSNTIIYIYIYIFPQTTLACRGSYLVANRIWFLCVAFFAVDGVG